MYIYGATPAAYTTRPENVYFDARSAAAALVNSTRGCDAFEFSTSFAGSYTVKLSAATAVPIYEYLYEVNINANRMLTLTAAA